MVIQRTDDQENQAETSTYPQDMVRPISLPEDIAKALPELAAASQTYAHPPLFTCDDGEAFRDLLPGRPSKNLFLKDKKGSIWLITAWQETRIDLNGFAAYLRAQHLLASRFTFGSAELLQEVLGVTPGSVTALALLNDHERRVNFVLDVALFDTAEVSFHPLRNDMTTVCPPQLLRSIVEKLGYRPLFVDFSASPPRSVEEFGDKMGK